MAPYIVLVSIWGVVTIALFALVIYRSRLESRETDWIPLTEDDKEDRAIKAQTVIEMKTRRLTLPIQALGTLSVVLLLVIIGFWMYKGITTPPPLP